MRIEFAAEAERDFILIFDHLVDSYMAFGESRTEALDRAEVRLAGILDDATRIATAPKRGSPHDDLMAGLRQLTLGSATFWFTVDATEQVVRVLAVFFGAQDQHRRMLIRLLGQE
ncbi:type II toxin-antitoxin system RelE/ParE family toxin [Paracoccus sp. SSK6]|uniref:type II toxin-antitoxin system RelE/ParE family toxin n=1 Tax=Paracoccus sp. SSK6 TaxID=3143131 RepID=UPI00321C237F